MRVTSNHYSVFMWGFLLDWIVEGEDWITYFQLFNIDTGVIGETFCICDLNVGFLQFISQIVSHL